MSPRVLVFAADCHIGNHKRFGGELVAGLNTRGRLALEAFGTAVQRADELGASDLFILGDLFDDDRPNPQLLAAVQRTLSPGMPAPEETHVMVGNHDQTSGAEGHHALAPLAPIANVIERPTIIGRLGNVHDDIEIALVPFMPARAGEYIPAAVRALEWKHASSTRILGIHAGIKDGATAPWLRESADAIDALALAGLCAEVGIETVFAGNWHDHRAWKIDGVSIVQIGSLVPTGFDDLSPEHGIAIWRDGEVTFEEIPGPRFAKVKTRHEVECERAGHGDAGNRVFISWTTPTDELAAASTHAEHVRGDVGGIEVLPDGAAVEVQAREAAEAARSEVGLDGALVAYVEAMPVPDGVDRGAVLDRARGYLR